MCHVKERDASEIFRLRMRRIIDSGLHAVALVDDSHLQLLFIVRCSLHLKQIRMVEHLLFDLADLALDSLTFLLLLIQLIRIMLVLLRVICRRHATINRHSIDNG